MTLTLPPEPYTVIQVHDSYGLRTWIRGDRYWSPLGDAACLTPDELEQQITNFKVLAGPAPAAVLGPVAQLHRKDTRWTIPPSEEYRSYDDREDALEDYRGYGLDLTDEQLEAGLRSFDICAECSRIEITLAQENGFDEWSIVQMWPCRTAVALGVAEAPRVS